MSFFSKIFGIDRGIDIAARKAVNHMQDIQKYIGERNELIKYLNVNKIDYFFENDILNKDVNNLCWNFKIANNQILHFVESDSLISAHFQGHPSNPLEAVDFVISHNRIWYNIGYPWKHQNRPIHQYCQTFIKSLNSHNIHTFLEND